VSLDEDARRVLETYRPRDTEQAETLERFQKLFAETADPTHRANPGAHVTASTVILSADHRRVLLCLHGRFGKWLQVGGHCEDEDTTLAATALREATEESGISGLVLDPEPIDLNIHPVKCRNGASLHYDVRYVAVAPAGAVPVVSEESHDLSWFDPAELPTPNAVELPNLIEAALNRVT
jgi:8-oxo-dGTP pyrophosphatase MutT (NUDIX family)